MWLSVESHISTTCYTDWDYYNVVITHVTVHFTAMKRKQFSMFTCIQDTCVIGHSMIGTGLGSIIWESITIMIVIGPNLGREQTWQT